nr:hypothetical protein Iba_chr10eCG9460 [Ipomoea batatas]
MIFSSSLTVVLVISPSFVPLTTTCSVSAATFLGVLSLPLGESYSSFPGFSILLLLVALPATGPRFPPYSLLRAPMRYPLLAAWCMHSVVSL